MNDLRYAVRMLRKRPGGTLVIIGTLALLIGAAGLALGVIQHHLSAWMPFPQSKQMVKLWQIGNQRPNDYFPASMYAQLREQIKSLDSIGAMERYQPYVMTGRGEPRRLTAFRVSSSVFDVAGVGFIVVEGFHRVRGANQAKRETITATIHEGNRNDASAFAAKANVNSKLPLKTAQYIRLLQYCCNSEGPTRPI